MQKMSKSYPFLWISKNHGVPYDVVMLAAQFLRKPYGDDTPMTAHEKRACDYVDAMDALERVDLLNDIEEANVEFRRIQREGWG